MLPIPHWCFQGNGSITEPRLQLLTGALKIYALLLSQTSSFSLLRLYTSVLTTEQYLSHSYGSYSVTDIGPFLQSPQCPSLMKVASPGYGTTGYSTQHNVLNQYFLNKNGHRRQHTA